MGNAPSVQNEWALILGGSSGFGLATAHKLSEHGLNICVVHRDRRGAMSRIEPEFEKIRERGVSRRRPPDRHNVTTRYHVFAEIPHQRPESPPDPDPVHGPADLAGRDEPKPEPAAVLRVMQHAEHHEASRVASARLTDSPEIGAASHPHISGHLHCRPPPEPRRFRLEGETTGATGRPRPVSRSVLLGVPLVVDLRPLGGKAFTALLAPALDNPAPRFGTHSGAKTMLAFTGSLGWLKCLFHR